MKKVIISIFMILFSAIIVAQDQSRIPLIGEEAPKFKANSTNGVIRFPKDFGSSWKVIFSHPMDFTPVCSSELLELAHMQNEFRELNVNIIVLSTDTLYNHVSWKLAMEQINYKDREPVKIQFPFVDDESRKVSLMYGMIHTPTSTTRNVRGVFIIDPDNIIRSIQFYPVELGRNMQEIKRAIIALQTADQCQVYTPANWNPGDDVILPWRDMEVLADPNVYQLTWFMTFKKL